MTHPEPRKRFYHIVSFVGAILGVLCAVTGWMLLSTATTERTGPGVALAAGAAGLWISFAGWVVYRRAIDKGSDARFSQRLIWIGMASSAIGALAFVLF